MLKLCVFWVPWEWDGFANILNPGGEQNEPLKSKTVRQALSLAVDRTLIIRDILKNNAEPARGPIPPGFVGYAADA